MTTKEDLVDEIKFALPEDVSQVAAFGFKTFKENNLEGYGVSPDLDKMIVNFTDWAINEAILVKRNDDDPKHIDGACAICKQTTWWSHSPVLMAALTYIKPEKRSFKLAYALLKAAQEYAIMNQLPLVVDIVGQTNVKKKIKLLKYLGFEEFGSLLVFKP